MNFTPLGTPAVTPHDAQFNPAQFTVPGEYFSPLVSPALEGQQQNRNNHHNASASASTASPVDFDMDMNVLGESATQQQSSQSGKAGGRRTRRTSAASTRGGARKVAQSPIQKANAGGGKRKSGLSSVIPPKEVTELLEMHAHTRMSPTSPASARLGGRGAYASSSDSISPEPLSEGLMRPPPKPHSARQSPMISANVKHHSPLVGPNGVGTMPATPASLMRLSGNKDSPNGLSVPHTIHEGHTDDIPMLDDLILPDAAAPVVDARTTLSRIDTASTNGGGDATPKVSARGGSSRSGPKSAPLLPLQQAGTPTTAKPSPLASTVTSPISSVSSPMLSRQPSSSKSRTAKKRGSVNALVSPALLPRISPSIKPLLPSGPSSGSGGGGSFTGLGISGKEETLTEEQHALLLTSRSNYQNLIEGRNIPGVTYPSDLPSQLTSKRTSHKIAEQGRRQRINVALQEMQGLLPKLSPGSAAAAKLEDEDEDEDEEGGNGKGGRKSGKGGGNSKAATVEHAISYIRAMQEKESCWAKEREEKDKEVEALRKKLDALERRLSVSKSPARAGAGAEVEVEEKESVEVEAEGGKTEEKVNSVEVEAKE